MRATIKEVAADAGVSIATVSHVINGTRAVSPETEKRVRDSIQRVNYYPNKLVGSMRGLHTKTIGMVIPSISNETFGRMTEMIQNRLFDVGYDLIVYSTSYDTELEERALESLITKRVDAVIAIPSASRSPMLNEYVRLGIPVVLIDRMLEDLKADAVTVDNRSGEYECVMHMIRMGHTHIGYIDRMLEQSHSFSQREGYMDALHDAGIPFRPEYIITASGHYYRGGVNAVQALMRRCPNITAIACYYDLIAFGVMRGLYELGSRVPDDVSVAGYDNMLFTEATWPALTTVEMPVEAIAENVCKLIIERLKKKEREMEPQHIELSPFLIVRESVHRIEGEAEA